MMKLIIFASLVAFAACESCSKDVKGVCQRPSPEGDITHCNAKYGQTDNKDWELLNDYLNVHIRRSFQYLLMSSHFGGYKMERNGFKKLYRKLSDSSWEDVFDMVKYMTKRGWNVDLKPCDPPKKEEKDVCHFFPKDETFTLKELESLAKAVDIQKKLAETAHNIYKVVNYKDPEMGSYLVDQFMPKHAKTVRELVGYTTDLKHLVKDTEEHRAVGLQIFLLDEYLNKNL